MYKLSFGFTRGYVTISWLGAVMNVFPHNIRLFLQTFFFPRQPCYCYHWYDPWMIFYIHWRCKLREGNSGQMLVHIWLNICPSHLIFNPIA